MTAWPFGDLRPGGYRVILADPPWKFASFTAATSAKSPEAHYATMPLAEIACLPISALAHPKGAMLALWTTFPFLGAAFDLLRHWGFRYSTGGSWAKVTAAGEPAAGTGYIYRSAAEPWLLARIHGGVSKRRGPGANGVRNLILEAPREHSRKPDAMHAQLETLFPGPYCELFARATRRGWATWGNETAKFDPRPSRSTS